MKRVTAVDGARNFGALTDLAAKEPVLLTRHGRDRVVVMSVERFEKILIRALAGADTDEFAHRMGSKLQQLASSASKAKLLSGSDATVA